MTRNYPTGRGDMKDCACGHPAYFHHELRSCDYDTDDGPCDCDGYEQPFNEPTYDNIAW